MHRDGIWTLAGAGTGMPLFQDVGRAVTANGAAKAAVFHDRYSESVGQGQVC